MTCKHDLELVQVTDELIIQKCKKCGVYFLSFNIPSEEDYTWEGDFE